MKREPFPNVVSLAELPTGEVENLRKRGLTMVARGEVAALLLAGGQGTRLGTSAPKGCYDIGLPSGKSLFQYHAEKLLKVRRLAAAHANVGEAAVRLKLLVMTSSATDAETRSFFATHDYFGLGESGVVFFAQVTLITHHSSPITHHPSLITHHSSRVGSRLLCAGHTHHPSLITHHSS